MGLSTIQPHLPRSCDATHGGKSCASSASRLEVDLSSDALLGASCLCFSTQMGSTTDLPQLSCVHDAAHGGNSCAYFASRLEVDLSSDAVSEASCLGFTTSPSWHVGAGSAFEPCGADAEICVFVRCPRRTVHVMVSPGATVGDLGLALYDAEGIPPRFQALRHASTLLDLLRPLTSYGIGDGSFLDLGGTSVLGGVSPVSPALGVLGRRRSTRIAAAVTTSPCPPVPHPTPQDAARTASPGSVLPPPLPTAAVESDFVGAITCRGTARGMIGTVHVAKVFNGVTHRGCVRDFQVYDDFGGGILHDIGYDDGDGEHLCFDAVMALHSDFLNLPAAAGDVPGPPVLVDRAPRAAAAQLVDAIAPQAASWPIPASLLNRPIYAKHGLGVIEGRIVAYVADASGRGSWTVSFLDPSCPCP